MTNPTPTPPLPAEHVTVTLVGHDMTAHALATAAARIDPTWRIEVTVDTAPVGDTSWAPSIVIAGRPFTDNELAAWKANQR